MIRFGCTISFRPARSFDPHFLELVEMCMRLSHQKAALEMAGERLERACRRAFSRAPVLRTPRRLRHIPRDSPQGRRWLGLRRTLPLDPERTGGIARTELSELDQGQMRRCERAIWLRMQ